MVDSAKTLICWRCHGQQGVNNVTLEMQRLGEYDYSGGWKKVQPPQKNAFDNSTTCTRTTRRSEGLRVSFASHRWTIENTKHLHSHSFSLIV